MNDKISVSVILPTYNEAKNLEQIIPALHDLFQKIRLPLEIVVVDDNSPDATAQVAKELAKNFPVVTHIRNAERSLSAAVIDGFNLATGEILIVMDADLSHPIESIPSMVEPILNRQFEITVGSRYIKGGGCKDWSLLRQLVSRGAGLLARGITPLSDPTSGFMAIRRSALSGIKLDPVGWKIVLETVVKTELPVKEIPIIFSDRIYGESKFTTSVQLLYLIHLWRLYGFRRPNMMQFVKFCIVGSSGVIVDTITLVLFVEYFALDKLTAGVGSFLCAVTWNFLLNRSWTFKEQSDYSPLISFSLFFAICSVGLFLKISTMELLISYAGFGVGFWYVAANLIGIVVSTFVNFLGSRKIAFKKIHK